LHFQGRFICQVAIFEIFSKSNRFFAAVDTKTAVFLCKFNKNGGLFLFDKYAFDAYNTKSVRKDVLLCQPIFAAVRAVPNKFCIFFVSFLHTNRENKKGDRKEKPL